MKLQLTQQEAAAIIGAKYQIAQCDVVISINTTPLGGNYVEAILRIVRLKYPYTYQVNDKIAAIKELRTMVAGLGLGDAKVAVEKPYEAIDYYLKNNKPLPNSY